MNPYQNTPTARLIADRIRDLSHCKTQAEIASDEGFPNANMITFLKNGRNKVPLDRVPSLAKALEVDPALLMRLALDQAVGATAAKAITEIFGTCQRQSKSEPKGSAKCCRFGVGMNAA